VYIDVYMTDKTIRVSEETWRKLRARKRGDESFDSVIKRELKETDPLAGFGSWSDTSIDESVQEVKEEMSEEFEESP
jgi:predicted CopG family antitoxin